MIRCAACANFGANRQSILRSSEAFRARLRTSMHEHDAVVRTVPTSSYVWPQFNHAGCGAEVKEASAGNISLEEIDEDISPGEGGLSVGAC